MRTLLWITITTMLYTAPMTIDYTADGYTYLIDNYGYEWEYERELGGEDVIVFISTNGTLDQEDDEIIDIQEKVDI